MRGLLIGAAAVLITVTALPPAAVAVWLLLGVVVGALAGVWTWLTGDPAHDHPVDVAVRTGGTATVAGLALGGAATTLGAAAPVLLVAATVAGAALLATNRIGRCC